MWNYYVIVLSQKKNSLFRSEYQLSRVFVHSFIQQQQHSSTYMFHPKRGGGGVVVVALCHGRESMWIHRSTCHTPKSYTTTPILAARGRQSPLLSYFPLLPSKISSSPAASNQQTLPQCVCIINCSSRMYKEEVPNYLLHLLLLHTQTHTVTMKEAAVPKPFLVKMYTLTLYTHPSSSSRPYSYNKNQKGKKLFSNPEECFPYLEYNIYLYTWRERERECRA